MKRVLQAILIAVPLMPLAQAGPAEEAEATSSKFFPAFVARNQAEVAAMFSPDAQFYGTQSTELVLTPQQTLVHAASSPTGA